MDTAKKKNIDEPTAAAAPSDVGVISSAEELLALNDTAPVKLLVPVWNKYVFVKPLTSGERGELDWEEFNANRQLIDSKNADQLALVFKRYRERLLVKSLCKPTGELLFASMEQFRAMEKLSEKNASALEWIAKQIQKVNAITDADIEELAKNSSSDQNAGSSSN